MAGAERQKSSRHSKITGDFAEALVLYWLSRYGYECARVDHTGIDLIARDPKAREVMGISVKCRDRYEARERVAVRLPADGFAKASRACESFGCVPYYAVVVDAGGVIRCFLLPLAHLVAVAGGNAGKDRCWRMTPGDLAGYRADPLIRGFELRTQSCSWRDLAAPASDPPPAEAKGSRTKRCT